MRSEKPDIINRYKHMQDMRGHQANLFEPYTFVAGGQEGEFPSPFPSIPAHA